MKYFLLCICSFLFSFFYSQNGIVNYGFIESLTIGNSIGDDYNSVLKFNDTQAEYISGKINLETPDRMNKETV